jgi:diacylglycerol kinase (ATP)
MKTFLKKRLNSISYVIKGMIILMLTEDSVKVQSVIFLIFTILGLSLDISSDDWKWQLFCFALLFTAEGLNTAIEKLCNFIHPTQHPKIGFIKDISAGAVGFATFFNIIIAILIYEKYV